MDKELLRAKLIETENLLMVAEDDLATALSALEGGPQANVSTVSEAVQNAFINLQSARSDVAQLMSQISDDESGA